MPDAGDDIANNDLPGPWIHRSVSANGSRFHIVDATIGSADATENVGGRPLLLLLHGFAEFWGTWQHLLPTLAAAGYRVVAVDLRGYGGSDKPPRGYDPYTLTGDVVGLIRALGERRATLIGHDWGGFLAWTTAALHPAMVDRIAVVSAAHPLRMRQALRSSRRQIAASAHLLAFQLPRYEHRLTRNHAAAIDQLFTRWAGPAWRETPDFAAYVARCQSGMLQQQTAFCALEYYRWALRSLTRRSGWRFARTLTHPITAPVLQIHGGVDSCVLPATARGSRKYAGRGLRYRELPDIGHFPQLEAPETVSTELLDWLPAPLG